jgi:hypothetical protein
LKNFLSIKRMLKKIFLKFDDPNDEKNFESYLNRRKVIEIQFYLYKIYLFYFLKIINIHLKKYI